MFAERDYLRQEMELLLGQVSSLEKEKGSLAQELRDFKELEEFKALEDDCSDDEKVWSCWTRLTLPTRLRLKHYEHVYALNITNTFTP